MHLLLPLGSSVLVVVGLTLLKQAQDRGASAWTTVVAMCWATGLVFPVLWTLGGEMQPWSLIWQPAIIGALFVAGQLVTLLAIRYGDVSIAAPVQGVKVLLVPLTAMVVMGESASVVVWVAAAIAMVGIVCVQTSDGTVHRGNVLLSVFLAFLGSISMSIFDILIQRWAPPWGPGRFLPLAAASMAIFATFMLPLANRPREVIRRRDWWAPLGFGSLLMSVQAIGMTFTLAKFGDATRVNIVYSLRGIWGVLITWWLLSSLRKRSETDVVGPSTRVMTMRMIGAVMIGAAVVISLSAPD